MTVLSTLWDIGKGACTYVYGIVDITLNPSRPIPKTDVHPRMPACPHTPTEYIRMFPYRHYWKHYPMLRAVVVIGLLFNFTVFAKSVYTTKGRLIENVIRHNLHQQEAGMMYANKQRLEDIKYFQKYDPKAKLRPKWFVEDFKTSHIDYYNTEGGMVQHH